jgi:hypothetical protein
MTIKTKINQTNGDAMTNQIDRLYDKLVDGLYIHQEISQVKQYAPRLKQLIKQWDSRAESIFAQECLSLAYEAEGDSEQAILHRVNEIRLIRRLHELAQGQDAAHADFLLKQYSYEDLSVRLDLLAILYHESGDLGKAISTLQESKQLCRDHRIKFEGEEILREYQEEQPNVPISVDLAIEVNGDIAVVPWLDKRLTNRVLRNPILESGEVASGVKTTHHEAAPPVPSAPVAQYSET